MAGSPLEGPWYLEFWYGDDRAHPHGIIEKGVPDDWVKAIQGAAVLSRDLCTCITVAADWAYRLSPDGDIGRGLDPLPVRCIGGMGAGDPIPGKSSEGHASGYCIGERIGRHYWVVIGDAEWIFDPTAHQFDSGICPTDSKPGIDLCRYWCDGRSFAGHRPLGLGSCTDR